MDHRPHIVVVEDEVAQRQLLVEYLGRQNFRVSGAEGGPALRKLMERELPALVLLDIGLPGMSGYAVAERTLIRSGTHGPLTSSPGTAPPRRGRGGHADLLTAASPP